MSWFGPAAVGPIADACGSRHPPPSAASALAPDPVFADGGDVCGASVVLGPTVAAPDDMDDADDAIAVLDESLRLERYSAHDSRTSRNHGAMPSCPTCRSALKSVPKMGRNSPTEAERAGDRGLLAAGGARVVG